MKEFTNSQAALILGVTKQTIGNRQRADLLPFPVTESDIHNWVDKERKVLDIILLRMNMLILVVD